MTTGDHVAILIAAAWGIFVLVVMMLWSAMPPPDNDTDAERKAEEQALEAENMSSGL